MRKLINPLKGKTEEEIKDFIRKEHEKASPVKEFLQRNTRARKLFNK